MKDHDTCPRAVVTIVRSVTSALDHTFVKMVAMAVATSHPDFRIQAM